MNDRTLGEKMDRFRQHKISVAIDYEGSPIVQAKLDELSRAFGDCLALALRDRSEHADALFSLGMAQEVDVEGGGS